MSKSTSPLRCWCRSAAQWPSARCPWPSRCERCPEGRRCCARACQRGTLSTSPAVGRPIRITKILTGERKLSDERTQPVSVRRSVAVAAFLISFALLLPAASACATISCLAFSDAGIGVGVFVSGGRFLSRIYRSRKLSWVPVGHCEASSAASCSTRAKIVKRQGGPCFAASCCLARVSQNWKTSSTATSAWIPSVWPVEFPWRRRPCYARCV